MEIVRTSNCGLIAKLNKNVHDLHVNLYPEYFKEYNEEECKAFFEGIIDKKEFEFLLLKGNDQPLGYAWIEKRNYQETPFKKSYQSIYVHQICISKDYWRMGYGSILMDEIYRTAKKLKICKIELDYWCHNDSAHSFYEKHGFVKYREFVYKDL